MQYLSVNESSQDLHLNMFAHFVADLHLFHQVSSLEVAHALPWRRLARLEVVDAELARAGLETHARAQSRMRGDGP